MKHSKMFNFQHETVVFVLCLRWKKLIFDVHMYCIETQQKQDISNLVIRSLHVWCSLHQWSWAKLWVIIIFLLHIIFCKNHLAINGRLDGASTRQIWMKGCLRLYVHRIPVNMLLVISVVRHGTQLKLKYCIFCLVGSKKVSLYYSLVLFFG